MECLFEMEEHKMDHGDSKSTSEIHIFILRVSTKSLGVGLPKTFWVKCSALMNFVYQMRSRSITELRV